MKRLTLTTNLFFFSKTKSISFFANFVLNQILVILTSSSNSARATCNIYFYSCKSDKTGIQLQLLALASFADK